MNCLFKNFVIGIHNLPDPIINEDGHYHSFDELYGTSTTEKDLPSASMATQKKTIPFNATQQHVKNVNLVIQCEECQMWRLLFSKSKLSPQSVVRLNSILEDISYTCGATFSDVVMPEGLQCVCIRHHNCYDPVEKLYYSCGFPDVICIYCSKMLPSTSESEDREFYPQCSDCLTKPAIKRVKKRRKK